MKLIQLQAVTKLPLSSVSYELKEILFSIALGIDDVKFMGNKALVMRIELPPAKLATLIERLAEISVVIDPAILEGYDLSDAEERITTLQVVSYSNETEGKSVVPNVPG